MPETEVVFFKENDGTVPFVEWLDQQPFKVQDKCFRSLKYLEANYEKNLDVRVKEK